MTTQTTNRMDLVFRKLKAENRTALIPFLTVGDPDLETTLAIITELETAGADILELGVPYSDPLADGPVIQRASARALRGEVHLRTCMETALKAREAGSSLPFILFSYYNPILQMGLDTFFADLNKHEISGLIIPDLPVEESAEMRRRSDEVGVNLIPLVAPTSSERIAKIVSGASGFIYCVSSLGVTGERSSFHADVEAFIASVRQATDLPVAVGFGISTGEQVARFAQICDGVVVGSAIVRKIEEVIPLLDHPATRNEGLLQIREFVAQLKRP
ncbi:MULTISPECIES: tryptophan synthase subunit alpha [Paenibacillus]|uniref:tryptophan synthase subunit alpha n=1 Tax=Paenibacillus TaxID=44249 RepID=UPI00096FC295|nr:tryptophan synthase subunit alpha [Paenibacillus odorifer]OMD01481.1 tryptophan synthase subunit alpha [Paenibacillus odorifer]OMD06811.1 tryptophan synthase subunit alpha [Paenibacillus odorifer]OME44019.1 tryptophan synthase subunit alpha [Paenibacillus odorifer]OME57836.1 tryptophan synthase subunit alpha [Paenibacillus odorifer]